MMKTVVGMVRHTAKRVNPSMRLRVMSTFVKDAGKSIGQRYGGSEKATNVGLGMQVNEAYYSHEPETDLLVLGCGVAGCAAALSAARNGLKVTVLTESAEIKNCNSFWAQGGIIYQGVNDSPELLAKDIFEAGAGVNNNEAVMKLAREGPSCVEDLLLDVAKVDFDKEKDGGLSLCLEASHSVARIIHWKDQTGKRITESLQAAVRDHPNITLVTSCTAIDLAMTYGPSASRCVGTHALRADGSLQTFIAKATVVATGGLGAVFEHTSNPDNSRGDGFALALRAGAHLGGMEYVQFHPTTLYIPGESRFLLTEALRGAGAILLNHDGEAFATKYHEKGELAPRDVVSRMITSEMNMSDKDHMYLDISSRDASWLKDRFPGIYEHCINRGLDMTKEPLPIVPAAHYFCGGVITDTKGRTTIPGLYGAGEVTCTGVHGANRLASTSLLEGLVWGATIGDEVAEECSQKSAVEPLVEVFRHDGSMEIEDGLVDKLWRGLRVTMWEKVGVERTSYGLEEAIRSLHSLRRESDVLYQNCRLDARTVGLRNAITTSSVIARAAYENPLSLGAHYVVDEESLKEANIN